MESRVQRTSESFIGNLTGASPAEIQKYVAEIRSNREFHDGIEAKRSTYGGRRYSSWGIGLSPPMGMVLYVICRGQKPDLVVETGVASGISSSYILCALDLNKHGELYSIDLPWSESGGGRQSGCLIPDHLRQQWHLISGSSSDKLAPLLEKLGQIDVFLHDSDHSYENMLWEFQTAWAHLKTGGALLSHNIDYNSAFADFCRSVKTRGYAFHEMGGLAKA